MPKVSKHWRFTVTLCGLLELLSSVHAAPSGYYRQPAVHDQTIVFQAEGDLWRVGINGGEATRLTSHPGEESLPAISPDGKTIAFVGQYEGPSEVYTMPLTGGLPTRRTFDGEGVTVVGWTRDGKILCATRCQSTLPDTQLITLDIGDSHVAAKGTVVPLAQAAEGTYDDSGKTLFFTRLSYQGSHTKRYEGGTAQNIWRFAENDAEATPLTASYLGTSRSPMFWHDRIYFASDRDGTMNIWSMNRDGSDLRQHTKFDGWDLASPSVSNGRIVFQLGADLHVYDIAANSDKLIPITLDSDLDQMREHWVQKPMEYVSAAHISPDGSEVALTVRGRAFVVPQKQGRVVEATHQQEVRYRDARFMPDGKQLLVLSDQTGEIEFVTMPVNGVGGYETLTHDSTVLRWEGVPSPDGKYIAHHDKSQRLWIFDVKSKTNRKIDESPVDSFSELRWSPDSKWLAYVAPLENLFRQVRICEVESGKITPVTSERFDSFSPAWSPDGKWLYLLSDRHLKTVVESPWGTYEPEPFLDKRTEIFQIALSATETRTPFMPRDELHPDKQGKDAAKSLPDAKTQPSTTQAAAATEPSPTTQPTTRPSTETAKIDVDGIQSRLLRVPIPPGNYTSLWVNDKGLFWLATPAGEEKSSLESAPITNEDPEVKTVASDIEAIELSNDGKKLLAERIVDVPQSGPITRGLFVIDAAPAKADLEKASVDLSHVKLSIIPREEWHAMFVDAWRMERDYFYDRNMHGVDWKAVRAQYEPLVDRVTTRGELSDLLGQMISELSALHMFVQGGDRREGSDRVMPASLGATLVRDPANGGYRVEHIYRSDPDEPDWAGPLARFGVNVKEGDIIEQINGTPTLNCPDIEELLRNTAEQQVLLRVKPKDGKESRDVIVKPMSVGALANLRYHEWEYTRRQKVENDGKGQIGYVHLRAMGGENFTEWAKGFYPVWNRAGLIIDVRHNRGGNIDSWIISRLLRKAWAYWSTRVSDFSTWNMQYAFRGHVVVLCDQWTASDGEAFTEGVKDLKVAHVIGTRTWGGEIWLSFDNVLVDRGIATAAEMGVFGPKGGWLIEGHGVEPDQVVDNLPHATFLGEDAQLQAAIAYLQKKIEEEPVKPMPPPKYPIKSHKRSPTEKPKALKE